MKSAFRTVLLAAFLVAWADDADARSFRQAQVPNGPTFDCGLCHIASNGGGARNGFGFQVDQTLSGGAGGNATADVDWAAFYDRDGDADGYSNGVELGDPEGDWTIGDAHPAGPLSDPSDIDSTPCGNGTIEGPEECEPGDLAGETCDSQGFGPGELSCSSRCNIDVSGCEGAPGNNNGEASDMGGNEADMGIVDGRDLGGMTGDTSGADVAVFINPVNEGGDDACATSPHRRASGTATLWLSGLLGVWLIRRHFTKT